MSDAALAPGHDARPIALPAPPVPGSQRWRVHIYPHTHWDREWYRTYERFRMQLVGVVDRVLHVLDSDPRFATFVLDGQTIVLEDYLAIRPEEEPRLRRLIAAGRLEVGPWYVLPDEFLVSGESLVRNLFEGRRVASRFGEPLGVGYLPDPFGHAAQLPAIVRGFGIDNVIFSRGMPDEFGRTGSEFRWEAPDGTDVLAIVQTSPYTNGYCNAERLGRGFGPDDEVPYETVRELAPFLAERARGDVLLLAAGTDHETVQQALPEIRDRLEPLLPGADVRITGLAAVVDSVRDAERRLDAEGRPLDRYRGELRGSLHAPILASIYSARIQLKQDNDLVQGLLERHVEPLMATAVLAGVRPARDVEPFIRAAWKLALRNHAHDSIGGCSIDEVHEEMHARTTRARSIGHGLIEDLRLALRLDDVAVAHDGEGCGGIAERGDGTPVALRPGRVGMLVPLAELVEQDGAAVVDDREVRGGALAARVREEDGERWLEIHPPGAEPIRLDWIDEADAGDEYDFGRLAGDVPLFARLERWATRMAGPGVAELEVVHEVDLPEALCDDRSARSAHTVRHEIRTRVRVAATSPLAQLAVELDNRARDHRLRLHATAGIVGGHVESHGHFAIVQRPARPATPTAPWKQEPPGLDHCLGAVRLVAGDGGRDIVLAGRGLHEYEVRELDEPGGGHALEFTVLRSVGWLSRPDVVGRPGNAGPPLETPGAQSLGPLRVDLGVGALLRPGADVHAARLEAVHAARAVLAQPLVLEPLQPEVSGEPGGLARARDVRSLAPDDPRGRIAALGLRVAARGSVPSAVKLADDGSGDLVVRWWAPVDVAQPRASLHLDVPVDRAVRCRLDEMPLGPAPWQDGVCELTLRPGGIASLRLSLAAPA